MSNECPSAEELSAWYDGETTEYEGMTGHLEQCALCRKFLEEIKALEASVKKEIGKGVPPDLGKRIRHRVNERLSKNK